MILKSILKLVLNVLFRSVINAIIVHDKVTLFLNSDPEARLMPSSNFLFLNSCVRNLTILFHTVFCVDLLLCFFLLLFDNVNTVHWSMDI